VHLLIYSRYQFHAGCKVAAPEVCIHELELTTVSGERARLVAAFPLLSFRFVLFSFPVFCFGAVVIALFNTLRFHKMWRVSSGASSEGAPTVLIFFMCVPICIDFPFYMPVFMYVPTCIDFLYVRTHLY
jgi:hypothetical protein